MTECPALLDENCKQVGYPKEKMPCLLTKRWRVANLRGMIALHVGRLAMAIPAQNDHGIIVGLPSNMVLFKAKRLILAAAYTTRVITPETLQGGLAPRLLV